MPLPHCCYWTEAVELHPRSSCLVVHLSTHNPAASKWRTLGSTLAQAAVSACVPQCHLGPTATVWRKASGHACMPQHPLPSQSRGKTLSSTLDWNAGHACMPWCSSTAASQRKLLSSTMNQITGCSFVTQGVPATDSAEENHQDPLWLRQLSSPLSLHRGLLPCSFEAQPTELCM